MDEIARGLLRTAANLVRLLRASWHCPGWGQKGSEWGRREGKNCVDYSPWYFFLQSAIACICFTHYVLFKDNMKDIVELKGYAYTSWGQSAWVSPSPTICLIHDLG